MKNTLIAASLFSFLISFSFNTHSKEIIEGKHYIVLNKSAQQKVKGKTVQEFFWYGCPHCFKVYPFIAEYKKNLPSDVTFESIPALFPNPKWEIMGRLFYTMKSLKKQEAMHSIIFDGIHKEKKNLFSERVLFPFLEDQGIDMGKFKGFNKSFFVSQQMNRAKKILKGYNLDGVPVFIINGKYKTSPNLSGSHDDFLIEVIEHLTNK